MTLTMSTSPRKRTRSQAFFDDSSNQKNELSNKSNLDPDQRSALEQDVWESFREEHYEAVDQLPLTLHRQLSLLKELDQQTQGYMSDLLPTLRKYIFLRHSIARRESQSALQHDGSTPEPLSILQPPGDDSVTSNNGGPATPVSRVNVPHTPTKIFIPPALSTPRPGTPMGIPKEREKTPETSREMLSHVAWLSEEILRASEEKVNLAQASSDSVDRHIRLLDEAIREQEASIALGTRPGTHFTLPTLVLPKVEKRSAVKERGSSPENPDLLLSKLHTAPPSINSTARGRPKREMTKAGMPASPLKIVLPATADRPYCYCNQPSYGEMIACDNPDCKREWFHLECTELSALPPENAKWYCKDCKGRRKRAR